MSLFFRKRQSKARKNPNRDHSTMPVSVTAENRQGDVCGLDRSHVPGPHDLDHRAAHAVMVMRQHSAFLADRSNTIEPPSREQLIEAYQDAEAFILGRLVIA